LRATTYRNNSRVFIFGAGVSKAVAGAPVMKELFREMEKRYECDKLKVDTCLVARNRVRLFKEFLSLIGKMESFALKPYARLKDSPNHSVEVKIREHIEYLITFLDMSIQYAPPVELKEGGLLLDSLPSVPFFGISSKQIKDARDAINIYLYLCLSGLEDEKDILGKFFHDHLRENDHLISFNYDLLVERSLLQLGKWSPLEGYVGVDAFKNEEDKKRIVSSDLGKSPYRLLKLHSSINWTWEYKGLQPENINHPIVMILDDWEEGFFFPKLEKILGRKPQGGYYPVWILPSYVKTFSKAPFLIEIWREAERMLSETKYLVLLGYSFPEQDSQSQLLFAALPDDCRILIVDPDANTIKTRIHKLFQFSNISTQNMVFEEWVIKRCPEI